ncbi:MAG: hypothetical protein A2Y64_03935 [Candidatus Coatesbacteria bacterium RBG_13_66_14]|uniref:Uncharacterized protein n=1 Tax=Candidatus Coatesbacteria bacterium RBG_13_66_14 TaxID=1817816 RepID=A0A1F5F767_9BACT|nr:MAG: hypothetical protein A2Y64_03935 [Candidatus Coatesbacteria bacterium RBG_13_66_14]
MEPAVDLLLDLLRRPLPAQRPVGHLLAAGGGEEHLAGVLEHQPHPLPDGLFVPPGLKPVHRQAPGVGQRGGQAEQQGGLPGAVPAQQRHAFPGGDPEVHAREHRRPLGVAESQALQGQRRGCGRVSQGMSRG